MKRTQLYLEENLWKALHAQARRDKTTVSELVRQAARDRYLGNKDARSEAMLGIIGIRKEHDPQDSTEYIRELRRGSRLDKLSADRS